MIKNVPRRKLIRNARAMKEKALGSIKIGMQAFNSFQDDGRLTCVLLHLQHACEMLLKASLIQNGQQIYDTNRGISFGFNKCVNLANTNCGLTSAEAGAMRSLDSLRDAEQHWLLVVEEDVLYLDVRAVITAFDDYLHRVFGERLGDHIPSRVMPISGTPAGDLLFLMDREYSTIKQLLKPGRRRRDEARGRIRSMLAMEALVADEVAMSERDINRIEKAIKAGKPIEKVFPRLLTIDTKTAGQGITYKVHFSKKEGAPVRFVTGDDPGGAAAVREIDLQRKFHLSATALANKLKFTPPRSVALRRYLKIDTDPECQHTFEFGKTKISYFSDTAFARMRDALQEVDMEEVWRKCRP